MTSSLDVRFKLFPWNATVSTYTLESDFYNIKFSSRLDPCQDKNLLVLTIVLVLLSKFWINAEEIGDERPESWSEETNIIYKYYMK